MLRLAPRSGINNTTSRLAGLFAVAAAGALANILYQRALGGVATQTGIPPFGILPGPEDPARVVMERAFSHAYSAALWMMAAWSLAAAILASLFVASLRTSNPRSTTVSS
jgi:hypothetical protein